MAFEPSAQLRAGALALLVGTGIAGCGGSSSLSVSQLRTRATRICTVAQRRTERISTPTLPGEGPRYLSRGIAVLTPELGDLRELSAPSGMAADFRTGVKALSAELRALRSSLNGLDTGNDPVVAIKTLQSQLAPLEARAGSAWVSLGIPACASR